MSNSPLDFLIIGQGLAGSLLAWHLHQLGQRILVIDRSNPQSASRMAAGLINPVTGKRLVKSSGVDTYLTHAQHCYEQLQQQFDQVFFHARPMCRLFQSDDEIAFWEKRKNDTEYQAYLGKRFNPDSHPTFKDPAGSFQQLQTGYLDTVALLDTLDTYFRENHISTHRDVDYQHIRFDKNVAYLDDIQTKHIIFCEGYKATTNPWFSWLPFKPAKGEILTLNIQDHLEQDIINAGKWLLPLNNGQFKLGATYEWTPLDEKPTQQGQNTLLDALKLLYRNKVEIEVVNHQAGVRPCTKDTMPFIGQHPTNHHLSIFNGFGSKGSLMIPYYAKQFSQHLLGKQATLTEADIKRYWKHDS